MEENDSNYFCKNAGLIICHPFLTPLFLNLNYLNDRKEFKDTDSAIRAVFLMHFIAKGTIIEIDEAELVLPKILCGIPINHIIKNEVVLSEEEQQLATEMLKAIITYWKTLGNVSVEGLRETFLRRNAILVKNADDYRLRVEKRAFDILLEQIPWSINIVKVPWNTNYFRVEW